MLTVKQAAAELNVSISFIYKLIGRKALTHELRGRIKLIPEQAIEEYRNRVTVQAIPEKQEFTFSHLYKGKK